MLTLPGSDTLDTMSGLTSDYETDFFDIESATSEIDKAESQGTTVATARGEYYFEDGDIYILVDDILFRVHKHFLSPSSISGADVRNTRDGSREEAPIVVPQVTKEDFQNLLWVFYDETLQREAPARKWIGILLTAEKLELKRVQELAVAKLIKPDLDFSGVDPITQIIVQQRHGMELEWARKAFMILIQRQESLTEEEATEIGVFATVTIAHMRESRRRRRHHPARWPPYLPCDDQIKPLPEECEPGLYLLPTHGGEFHVLVEGHRFCVHLYILKQHSPIIRTMLATRSSGDGDLSLPGIRSRHFSWLLQLFYEEAFHMKATPTQLAAIRRIAGQYEMDAVIGLTTKQMRATMTAVEQIKAIDLFGIEDKYSQEPWNVVHQRSKPLTLQEGRQLGPRLCARMAKHREDSGRFP
ncbi:hypothetical protein PC9H_005632 [Pleurotus ostreatus]|uniref:BTB domain-containing protein n=1 Tax=Pleurotus ostreatus TaxID=5322 RepID=A0A8H6ZXG8_PLEOS|nr:uncharacterized protein PC9H_005632 [Pleurotus ostreatus]KAF7433670.1 hypothetical protein PC9H_005632 [Pleurotus ostreatus]KAJ8697583.1 hypothetical protein PTI98_004370 [Pleurotus ostreatus]